MAMLARRVLLMAVLALGACLAAVPASAAALTVEPEYPVGVTTVTFVEPGRYVELPGHRFVPRILKTVVRYPALAPEGAVGVRNAEPFEGQYPLVVFAHGFGVTPETYAALLNFWAQSGFVVAAPYFPRTSAGAPGGLDAEDVVNQPRDVSTVITGMEGLSASSGNLLSGTLLPGEIAVAGHSDGAETALAAGYARRLRDRRIRADLVFSGAEIGGTGGYYFGRGTPALFAAQGTADHYNEPRYTYAYFARAHRPKFLLRLLGAGHLPPFQYQQPQLGLVEQASTAFLDRYLLGSVTSGELVADAWLPRFAAFTALP